MAGLLGFVGGAAQGAGQVLTEQRSNRETERREERLRQFQIERDETSHQRQTERDETSHQRQLDRDIQSRLEQDRAKGEERDFQVERDATAHGRALSLAQENRKDARMSADLSALDKWHLKQSEEIDKWESEHGAPDQAAMRRKRTDMLYREKQGEIYGRYGIKPKDAEPAPGAADDPLAAKLKEQFGDGGPGGDPAVEPEKPAEPELPADAPVAEAPKPRRGLLGMPATTKAPSRYPHKEQELASINAALQALGDTVRKEGRMSPEVQARIKELSDRQNILMSELNAKR